MKRLLIAGIVVAAAMGMIVGCASTKRCWRKCFPSDNSTMMMAFRNAPLIIVIEDYGKWIGKTVIVDKGVTTTLTLEPGKPISKTEAIALIEKALADAGLIVTTVDAHTVQISRKIKSESTNTPAISRKVLSKGGAEAQYELGTYYAKGNGVVQDHFYWCRKSAEQGYDVAQCELGDYYYQGNGILQDFTNAVIWYRKAAEQGNPTAQYALGRCYYRGDGVTQDYTNAVIWYRKAAEQDEDRAQRKLGYCYENGLGVSKDPEEAAKWYGKVTPKIFHGKLSSTKTNAIYRMTLHRRESVPFQPTNEVTNAIANFPTNAATDAPSVPPPP